MAGEDGLDERRPITVTGIAWDVLVLIVLVYIAFADPLAIGWLRDFAAKPLDVCATMVLIIDVPRQALSIVLAHHRAIAENASAATLAAKDEGKLINGGNEEESTPPPSQQWGVLAVGLTLGLWPALVSASASIVLDVLLLSESAVPFGWFAALRFGRLLKCTTWGTSMHSLWRGLSALITGGEPTSFQLEQLALQYDAVISLLNLFFVVVLTAHVLSCAWGGFYYKDELPTAVGNFSDSYEVLGKRYLWSFYWAVTTISTVGYGDITPSNSDERWLIIVAEVCAVSVFGCIIGVVTTLLKQLNRERMLREQTNERITNFMLEHKMGIRLQERVHAHFDYYYRQRSVFNTQRLLEDLPPTLRLALIERLCGNFFNPAFGSMADVAVDVKLILANAFVPFHLYTNEVLAYEGQLSLDLFFITAGRLQRYKADEPSDELTEGQHIGEVYDKEYLFSCSVVALEPSRLFSVPHATVRELSARFSASHLPHALRVQKNVDKENRTTDAKAAWKKASAIKRGMAFRTSLKHLRVELSSTEHGWQDTLAADGVHFARPTQSAWLRAEIRDAFAARCIHPKARLKVAFDVLLALAIVYSTFTAPLWFALRVRDDAQLPAALRAIDAIVDVLYVLEVPVNFRTVHLDANGTPVLDTRMLAQRYARTWFAPDLVAALPLAHVPGLRWFGLFRLCKFPKALGSVQQHGSVVMHPAWLSILKQIIGLFSIAHFCACLWLAVPAWACAAVHEAPLSIYPDASLPLSRWESAVYDGSGEATCAAPVCMARPPSWPTALVAHFGSPPCVADDAGLGLSALGAVTNATCSATDNWLWRYGSQCERPWSNYQIALMWSLTTLTTVGYGDVCPHEDSPLELLVAIVVMLLGSTIFAVVISNFTELMSKFSMHQKVVKDKMHEVDAFVRSAGLERNLASALHGFFSYKMSSSVSHILGDNSVMSKLSPPLRHAVLRNMLIHEASPVMKCPLFSDLEDEIVTSTVHMMEALFLVPNDVLFREGEPGFHMYFLIDGVVDIESGDGASVYATRVGGEYFGEVALTVSAGRTATARAKTFSSLYSLSKERFQIIMDLYPEARRNVYNEAGKRLSHVTKSSGSDTDRRKPRSADSSDSSGSVEHGIIEHQDTLPDVDRDTSKRAQSRGRSARGRAALKKMSLTSSFGSAQLQQVSAEALSCQAENSAMSFKATRASDDAIPEASCEQSAATRVHEATAHLRHELDAKIGECEQLREELAKAQEALKEAEAAVAAAAAAATAKPTDDGGSFGPGAGGGALAC